MEKIKLAGEIANEQAQDVVDQDVAGNDREIRALRDLEMVLVGGGSDGAVVWG